MHILEEKAESIGFASQAVIKTKELIFVDEYRLFCEDNYCGNYDKLPMCPPECGTVEELHQRVMKYENVLVLQTIWDTTNRETDADYKKMKQQHNTLTYELVKLAEDSGYEGLVITAGPSAHASCMSAYCIDAAKMAESCGMKYICGEHKVAFFSQFCFNEN
ncbi:MAG: DUF2284 domain-containing protein [Lachnospiraceae bacterium]|nr:DUF2284 domain-containing protein [Lachnospiraceae bacterium]MDD3617751.1 DUF2284 domain-containing protein [Lachnospiraceae bacterium]